MLMKSHRPRQLSSMDKFENDERTLWYVQWFGESTVHSYFFKSLQKAFIASEKERNQRLL